MDESDIVDHFTKIIELHEKLIEDDKNIKKNIENVKKTEDDNIKLTQQRDESLSSASVDAIINCQNEIVNNMISSIGCQQKIAILKTQSMMDMLEFELINSTEEIYLEEYKTNHKSLLKLLNDQKELIQIDLKIKTRKQEVDNEFKALNRELIQFAEDVNKIVNECRMKKYGVGDIVKMFSEKKQLREALIKKVEKIHEEEMQLMNQIRFSSVAIVKNKHECFQYMKNYIKS